MSAIRSLRCAARVASFSTRSVSRTAVARPSQLFAGRLSVQRVSPSIRSFSSSRPVFGQGQSDIALSEKLEEEIKYETAEATPEVPEFLAEFKKAGVWEVDSKKGHDEVVLVRKFGNETVRVMFSISDIDNTEFEQDAENSEDGVHSASFPIRCAVTITKAGEGALTVECFTQEGAFTVENISFYSDPSLAVDTTAEADWKRRGLYIGPQFEHLDPSVQEKFEQYLAERGVDESLALFIPEFAEHKEQTEYFSWLKNVRKFVDA
jgi:complement component 1 Q subcomponent-binding protein